jgi:hypothetical protein
MSHDCDAAQPKNGTLPQTAKRPTPRENLAELQELFPGRFVMDQQPEGTSLILVGGQRRPQPKTKS